MPRSMTAYARAATEQDWGHAVWELRGVNNRYLDAVFRLPEELRFMEPMLRERVTAKVNRGKLECNLKLDMTNAQTDALSVDLELARQLADAAHTVAQVVTPSAPLRIADVMRWPGVVRTGTRDMEVLQAPLQQLLDQALHDLIATREREGQRIEQMLLERCNEITRIVAQLRERGPQLIELARTRLRERLNELMTSLDHDRIEQEIVLLANKQDVAEELDRLDSHIAEVRDVMKRRQPIGRRLDFLMQELNREANTLGSKSSDADSTRDSVDLKVLIEQMREQIQNLE